jgi:hypothetical protein
MPRVSVVTDEGLRYFSLNDFSRPLDIVRIFPDLRMSDVADSPEKLSRIRHEFEFAFGLR